MTALLRGSALSLAALLCVSCARDTAPPASGEGPALVATRCGPDGPPPVDCARGPKHTPFACMRFDANCQVDVQLEDAGAWYRFEGIDGISLQGLGAAADAACKPADGTPGTMAAWKRKRLAEDLPAIVSAACGTLGDTADLALRDLASGAWVVRSGVPSTPDNRTRTRACWPEHDACRD